MSNAHSNEVYALPEIVSFTFSPNEIELTAPSTNLKFELVVSHPIGIENSRVTVSLNSATSSLTLDLFRTDIPLNKSLKTVTFNGSIDIPRNIKSGVYKVESGQILGIALRNSLTNPVSSPFKITKKMNNITGAETDLIIRSGGDLSFDYQTFIGPSHATLLKTARDLPKLLKVVTPIWKVGEIYVPTDYYELRVPELELGISSKNPEVCASDGNKLTFISVGSCSYLVFTKKNSNYIYKQDEQLATITSARTTQELVVENLPSQKASNLPKVIQIPRVYSGNFGFLSPKSLTPTICLVSDGFISIFSGGICRYSYQSEANSISLASKVYELEFEITRDAQTIIFALPGTAKVSSRSITLTATASSGAVVSYSTNSTGICSITGSTLNLLASGNCSVTATQAGTSTLAPIASTATVMLTDSVVIDKKRITCVKGKSTKKVSGINPKCPKGFKLKS